MKTIRSCLTVAAIAALIMVMVPVIAGAAGNPKDRLEYWQKNFDELKPYDDARAKKAHEIFARVLSAAGRRPGVTPRLFIVKSEAAYVPLAIAIPDGGVIISKKVLDLCYGDPGYGDDRLAFILGHEIAHQLKDDFWHMKFFQAVEISQGKDAGRAAVLNEVRAIAGSTENVLAKELQADEHGIIYASLAGYDTASIVTGDNKVNFFEYVARSMDPGNIKGIKQAATHPAPAQRAETVKARLRQVLEKVEVFSLGILFYQAGDYRRALLAFEEFLRYFPSREVYHNAAACHHQMALKQYRAWKGDRDPLPFQLSISIDPSTLASGIRLRGKAAPTPEALFREHLAKAIENYEKAILLDPSYYLSYNNLGCAYVLKEEPYKAIAMLKDALKVAPGNKEALNNLGVAFFFAENPGKAKESLLAAHKADPGYDAPLFNLGKIAREEKNGVEEKKYWGMYLGSGPAGPRAEAVRSMTGATVALAAKTGKAPVQEGIGGLKAGADARETAASYGKPLASQKIRLEEDPFIVERYANDLTVVSQDGGVMLIVAGEKSREKTSRSIRAGSREEEVLTLHGRSCEVEAITGGRNIVCKEQGVAFRIRDGKVVSWLVF